MVRRIAAIWMAMLIALAAVGWSAPAAAQSTASYKAQLDSLALEMRALWGELERFQPAKQYCLPPGIPSKAEDQAKLDALEQRVKDLNARYLAARQGLMTFLGNNHRLYAELMVDGVDPSANSWWSWYDSNRRRMNDELARKKAALAAAPEVDCSKKPKTTVGTTGGQPPSQGGSQQSSLPQRPSYAPLAWPPLPPFFCSWDEYWKFINDIINPLYVKAAENAERAAEFRTAVERAVNAHVQAGSAVPPALAALRRQAIADVAEQNRLSQEAEDIRRRAKAIPVIDCSKDKKTGAVLEQPGETQTARIAGEDRYETQPGVTTGPAPGVSAQDEQQIALQQAVIEDVEAAIAEMKELRQTGQCEELWEAAEDMAEWLHILGRQGNISPVTGTARPPLPPALIEEWNGQIDDIMEGCPPPRIAGPDRYQTPISIYIPPQGSFGWRMLNEHNKARAEVGSPPLQWDPALAAGAAAYASQLTQLGRVHASREGRKDVRENLLQSLRGGRTTEQMVGVWTAEKRYFRPGVFPNVSTTGNWADVGHYTQMVWPTTTRIGCAVHSDARFDWTVCRYSPPGNRDGSPILMDPRPPVLANQGDIAPPTSSTPTIRPDLYRLPIGGGMTQLDPPPPPRPTARDDAPDGKEEIHPLVRFGVEADARHAVETDCGNTTMARLELERMRYALDELKKRLKAAKQAGPYSAVKPADVQRQIDEMERRIREAEQRRPRGTCPPMPQPRGVVNQLNPSMR